MKYAVTIHIPIDPTRTEARPFGGQPGDIECRHGLEDALTQTTKSAGGYVDGGGFGCGSMDVFVYDVEKPELLTSRAIAFLAEAERPDFEIKVRAGKGVPRRLTKAERKAKAIR